MYRYKIDSAQLKKTVLTKGYTSLSQFLEKSAVNRMTLHHYLKGDGPLSEPYYALCAALDVDPLDLLTPLVSKRNIPYQEEIVPIIKEVVKKEKGLAIGLLGSRARDKAKKYSDWDLGLTLGQANLVTKDYFRLKTLIQDLSDNLTRSVDIINLDQAPVWFLQSIDYEPLFLGGNKLNWEYFLGVLHGIKKNE